MSDYREVLQNPQVCFNNPELQKASLQNNPLGLPVLVSGGFALTACATVNVSGNRSQLAIRCFHKEVIDLQERYQYISNFLNSQNEDFFVNFTYEPQGIRVQGKSYPIIKMAWVNGIPLDRYIENHIKEPNRLLALLDEIKYISIRLSQLKMAHGDLQHGNILVRNPGKCVLIDYDGIYVQQMPYSHSNEIGHPSFQHPGRDGSFFNDRMDNFSLIVIWTSLYILSTSSGPELWQRYHDSENLIFSKEDYRNPNQSELFSELVNHPEVGKWVNRLKDLCSCQVKDIPRLEKFLEVNLTLPQSNPTPLSVTTRPSNVIAANNLTELIEQEGNQITIVGRIINVVSRTVNYREIVFINFGKYQKNYFIHGNEYTSFTIVIFSEQIEAWNKTRKESLRDLKNCYIQATGLLEIYKHPQKGTFIPQIILNNPYQIKITTEKQISTPYPVNPPISQPPTKPSNNTTGSTSNLPAKNPSNNTTGSTSNLPPKPKPPQPVTPTTSSSYTSSNSTPKTPTPTTSSSYTSSNSTPNPPEPPENNSNGVGTGIGVVIGAVLGGPPGAVVGGIAGAFIGKWLKSSDKK